MADFGKPPIKIMHLQYKKTTIATTYEIIAVLTDVSKHFSEIKDIIQIFGIELAQPALP